jgi:hypothetical protein
MGIYMPDQKVVHMLEVPPPWSSNLNIFGANRDIVVSFFLQIGLLVFLTLVILR